jgi:hypothetical protein
MRKCLPWIVGALLVCQALVLTLTPISLCVGMTATDCTCPHADEPVCPIHHQPATGSRSDCWCFGSHDGAMATVVSAFGPAAVLVHLTNVNRPAIAPRVSLNPQSFPLDALIVPDSPPPRA